MNIRRLFLVVASGVLIGTTLAFPESVAATWTASCTVDGYHNMYAGMGVSPTGLIGASAQVRWYDTSLCNQGPTPDYSWSLSWVALVGVSTQDIFQVGFGKCANVPTTSTSSSCPYNSGVSYHWYYYQRAGGGPCGAEFNTTFQKAPKGNASAGTYTYAIQQKSDTSGTYFAATIDGQEQTRRSTSDLNVCWQGGITGAQYMNEMLDAGDQNGGTVSSHQPFSAITYQSSTGWHNTSWTLLRNCDANSDPTDWSCVVSSTSHNTFYNYDRRAP